MKKVHLICNAHIDPVWQWEWEEGASSALASFQSAANLLGEYDFVFNHNEVTLYQYTERFAPELFRQIQELNKKGRWNIMGGWYLQPDAMMPCGEGMVRQIQEGKEYFTRKFTNYPKTAIGFDSFGHSRGLVQIIRKCGQENYIFMRPGPYQSGSTAVPLEKNLFYWEGYDGSRVKAYKFTTYGTHMGRAAEKIRSDIKSRQNEDEIIAPWGVGNHGGGPSRKDLEDIRKLQEECKGQLEIVHSTPDAFFRDNEPDYVYDKSLKSCMVGGYTSDADLKQKYRTLETELFFTEKICSIAAMKGASEYPGELFREVTRDMMSMEFHDILPGDSIKSAEETAYKYAYHGLELLNRARADAFFGLIRGEKTAVPGTYPVFAFNPKTYDDEQYVEGEASFLVDPDFDNGNKVILIDIRDENGNLIPSQTIKEEANLHCQWRKRFIFKTSLKPLQVTRFSATFHEAPKEVAVYKTNEDVDFDNGVKSVHISAKTGLIDSYKVHGKEYAKGNLFEPFIYEDYADPWGMKYSTVGHDGVPFDRMKEMRGVFADLKSFEIIEDGDMFLGCEAFFEKGDSRARVAYRLYKEGDAVDVEVTFFPLDINKAFKVHVPVVGKDYTGDQMFGTENLYMDGKEDLAHDFVAVKEEDGNYLEIVTPTNYGSSYKDGTIVLTCCRSVTFCAHPMPWEPLVRPDIYLPKVDAGARNFRFRLQLAKEGELKRNADLFIEKPYVLNVFPTIDRKKDNGLVISTDNDHINVVTLKKGVQVDGYVMRLQNDSSEDEKCTVRVGKQDIILSFSRFEVKTLVINDEGIREAEEMYI